ncbi:plastid division protein PDV2 [Iris pallida]|uniref:Plastid division protein PDV2 n=1 Tax=Iris pallida TaxID=29817 RepID=A0AAX6G1Z3_IRIPA|nr:plastid division protein PDV2 [Iris pallida]
MEGEEIGMFLARASEMRSKFSECIDRCGGDKRRREEEIEEDEAEDIGEEEEEEEEEGSLGNIRDVFESLENQLSSLQALQQQQRYEREASLVQIGHSRMLLLSKLKEYKGDHLEVISEALTFADRTLRLDDDLLLPPYPSHLPDLFVLDDLYSSSHITSKYKLHQNGFTGEVMQEAKKNMSGTEERHNQPSDRKNPKGIRFAFGLVGKSALVLAGFVCILNLSGFKTLIRNDGIEIKIQEFFKRLAAKERRTLECPTGKLLVVEDGKSRCIVKERVEIPFDLDVTVPKISYGLG